MHHLAPARFLLVGLVVLGPVLSARAETPRASALAQARRDLDGQNPVAAVGTLERALPDAGRDKPAVLELLRKAYDQAARQCEARGKPAEAETYRENLRILNRSAKPAPAADPAPASAPAPATEVPATVELPPEPVAVPSRPAPMPVEEKPAPLTPVLEPLPEIRAQHPPDDPGDIEAIRTVPSKPAETPPAIDPGTRPPALPEPKELLPTPNPSPTVGLEAADAAFLATKYAEAGRMYAALAREKKLPTERNDCWAYCRSVVVAQRINAGPADRAEWASIDQEIQQIRRLDPNNWIGEYLRNLAAERPGSRKAAAGGPPVVRGSSPEEPPAAKTVPIRAQSPSAPNGPAARPAQAMGRWQMRETTNFQIYHNDINLANQVAMVAESTRVRQTKFWTGAEPRERWQPKCEIYLYPNAKLYAQQTGQPEDSPGFSTMNMNQGRLIGRRVNVRIDHPTAISAVLPHEITHVILADWFTQQQIPRWADEGMAVLSEPVEEQRRRAADLNKPLTDDRMFRIADLMAMDYPESQYWDLYYAQSVSLTRFLVDLGGPPLLVKFLQAAQKGDPEVELKRHYQISGHDDLQKQWLAYARKQAAAPAVATPATRPNNRVR